MADPTRKLHSPRLSRKTEFPDATPLLLATGLEEIEVRRLLEAYDFKDWKRADRNLQAMAGEPVERKALAGIVNRLLAAASASADPDQALNEWERFTGSGIHRLQLYQFLGAAPHVVTVLSTVFGHSPAMAQTFHRDPLLVYWIEDDRVLLRRQTRQSLHDQCRRALEAVRTTEAKYEALRRFKRREMLRIGIRDFLGEASVEETYQILSELSAVVIQAAYELVNEDLKNKYGDFGYSDRSPPSTVGFCVLGMGKLGGWELNYSSDVDLVYVYQTPPKEPQGRMGASGIGFKEYFDMLGRELTKVLSATTSEGALFRVDLRLRPEGSVGALACSVEDALHYYGTRGRTWERLAFLKAKPIAGNLQVGQTLLKRLRPFVLGPLDQADEIMASIRTLRAQILSRIGRRHELERHVKLGIGGIREVEFIVQGLQLRWGHHHPRIMNRQTLKGLARLVRVGLMNSHDAGHLRSAYRFLRDLEHKIQMVHELQTHLLPAKVEEIAKCAIRMGRGKNGSAAQIAEAFMNEYRLHTTRVHTLYQRIIGKPA